MKNQNVKNRQSNKIHPELPLTKLEEATASAPNIPASYIPSVCSLYEHHPNPWNRIPRSNTTRIVKIRSQTLICRESS